MTNSAHDDISIIGDYLPNSFSHEKDLQKVYELIHEMQRSEALGDAQILHQKLKLQQLDDENTCVEFDVDSIISPGWLSGSIGSYFNTHFSEALSTEDIEAIANNNFSMQILLHEERTSIQLDDLINMMDIYEIGRPSTVGSTLEKMMADKSLLTHSGGEISLTEDGRFVLQELKEQFGDIANIGWNLKFAAELMDISDGSLPPKQALLSVFESLYGANGREEAEVQSWTDPDVLHEDLDKSNQVKLGGVISIGDSFGGW